MGVNYGGSSGIGGRCLGSKNELNGSWRIGDIARGWFIWREGGENLLSRATVAGTSASMQQYINNGSICKEASLCIISLLGGGDPSMATPSAGGFDVGLSSTSTGQRRHIVRTRHPPR